MTDFNSFNPDSGLRANLNNKRQSGSGKPQPSPSVHAGAPPVDPYADLKTDPNKMLNLMAAQGRQNIYTQLESPVIENSVLGFTGSISPERHAQVSKLMAQTYQNETGRPPSPGLLQDMVDNYLIGSVVINNPSPNV